MDLQIKEEVADQSLDVVDVESLNNQDIAELSFVEKYDQFKLTDDIESDSFPDFPDIMLRNNYSLTCTGDTTPNNNNNSSDNNNKTKSRLSIGLPRRRLGSTREEETRLSLVRKLEAANQRGDLELDDVQIRFGDVLDYLEDKSKCFERRKRSEEQVDGEQNNGDDNNVECERDDIFKALLDKMESLKRVRDRYHEVEQQVREYIEQLELVERYKMESVE